MHTNIKENESNVKQNNSFFVLHLTPHDYTNLTRSKTRMASYKIKDLEILTGVKAHTLRIWEKRYDFIKPDRTDTQIRTYSDEELVILLNVALLNKNGVKISRIAEMSQEQVAQKVMEVTSKKDPGVSQEKLLLALIELDEQLFRDTLQELIDTCGLEQTFTDHLIPFLDRIGIMWLVGTINPAQEHFISNLIRQKIIATIDNLPIPEHYGQPVMLFLPEHEWHEISLLFYQFSLRNMGIPTVYLGQSVPYDSLLLAIKKVNPRALVSSWLTAVDHQFMLNYFQQLNKEISGIPHFAGGYQVNSNSEQLSGLIREIKVLADLENVRELVM
jgi:DNA-binding transcriptional MerR regulator